MKNKLALSFLFIFGLAYAVSAQKSVEPFFIGESVTLHSEILHEDRVLNVYLPQDYSPDSAKAYPVIYLLDGSADEDFIHVSGLVQFLSFSWIEIIPECIVVGIANVDRRRDFTYPTTIEEDKTNNPTSGHSVPFMEFIEKELQPFIDKQYKTTSERTLIGQSLGGLLTTEILVKKTALFDTYFIISPSLWWDHGSLLDYAIDLDLAGKTIYIAVGKEGKLMVGPAKKLYGLCKKMAGSDTRVFYQYFKDKTHGDVLHQALYEGFEMVKME